MGVDFSTYMYMWDSRHFWGLSHPARPSLLWQVFGAIYTILSLYSIFRVPVDGETRMQVLSRQAYDWLTLLSGVLMLVVGIHAFTKIESKRLLAFEIDEMNLRINHYFKRKEAIFSQLGFTLLSIATTRLVILVLLFW